MEPITRSEIFMAAAAGEYTGELPEPLTRNEYYLHKVCERFDNIDKPTDSQVQTAVDNYLDQNGVVFNTSAEITEVLNGN